MRELRAGRWGPERKEPGGGWGEGPGETWGGTDLLCPVHSWRKCACREGTACLHRPHDGRPLHAPPPPAPGRGTRGYCTSMSRGACQVGGPVPGSALLAPLHGCLLSMCFRPLTPHSLGDPPFPEAWPALHPGVQGETIPGVQGSRARLQHPPVRLRLQEQSRSRASAHPSRNTELPIQRTLGFRCGAYEGGLAVW